MWDDALNQSFGIKRHQRNDDIAHIQIRGCGMNDCQ